MLCEDLASTSTSALTACRREFAEAAADLSSFSLQRRVPLGIISAKDCISNSKVYINPKPENIHETKQNKKLKGKYNLVKIN